MVVSRWDGGVGKLIERPFGLAACYMTLDVIFMQKKFGQSSPKCDLSIKNAFTGDLPTT